jgi:GT2 family glycosyltransferase
VAECSIIIPVFNQAALTRECLDMVLGNPEVGANIEVIVVDDGSTESLQTVMDDYRDRVRFVRHLMNVGFAAVCNDGAEHSTGRWLVFLNNDTLPQAGWLQALLQYAADHPRAAVVGSKLLYPNGTIQHAGVVVCQDLYPRHVYAGFSRDHPAVNRSRQFQIVTAACALVRRDTFTEVGGFDTSFRNGYEDVDLCLRLGERGHEVHYCHKSVVYHLETMSREEGQTVMNLANDQLYRERWWHRLRPDDLDYYVADGLLRLKYGETYPATLELSPLLATLESADRNRQADRLLVARSRQVFELLKENTRLKRAAGESMSSSIPGGNSQPAGQ